MSRMIPSGQTAATPLGLLKRLGALETHESQLMIEAFSTRQLGFDWMHLGMTDLAIGTLLDVIRSVPALAPPRSGHLGNWDEILNGRAGMMDFNLAICGQNLGYPLIYCFNQTEDATLQQGDWVYLPGSLVSHGRRQELPLFTWDGTCFRRRDRSQPLFTPLVNVEFDGHLVPLVTVHWARMQQGSSLPFRLEATVFHRHAGLLKQILLVLLEDASHQANPRRAFQDLFSHQVSLDGRMSRAEVQREGAGYRVGEAVYSSADELVGAALLPFMAVAEPDQFMQIIGGLPGRFPLISNTLSGVLSALLSTHYPDGLIDRATMTQPFNPHFHWGARDMAGYPPSKKGYFAEKSTIKSYRKLCQTIIGSFSEFDPVFVLLLPAVIFALWPTDHHSGDQEAIADLIRQIRRHDGQSSGQAEQAAVIDAIVARWLADRAGHGVSGYFLNRFAPRQGILNHATFARSMPIEPEGFRDLSIRQACMAVGSLINHLRSGVPSTTSTIQDERNTI